MCIRDRRSRGQQAVHECLGWRLARLRTSHVRDPGHGYDEPDAIDFSRVLRWRGERTGDCRTADKRDELIIPVTPVSDMVGPEPGQPPTRAYPS